jgi:hypothetical protein
MLLLVVVLQLPVLTIQRIGFDEISKKEVVVESSMQ